MSQVWGQGSVQGQDLADVMVLSDEAKAKQLREQAAKKNLQTAFNGQPSQAGQMQTGAQVGLQQAQGRGRAQALVAVQDEARIHPLGGPPDSAQARDIFRGLSPHLHLEDPEAFVRGLGRGRAG